MSEEYPTLEEAVQNVAYELRRLGFGNACMDGKGALEVHGMHMRAGIDDIAHSLSDIAEALEHVAQAIEGHGKEKEE